VPTVGRAGPACYETSVLLQKIGRSVASARKRASLSVARLAEAANVGEGAVIALERGEPGMMASELDRIAVALGLAPAALLRGELVELRSPSVFLRHQAAMDLRDADLGRLDAAMVEGRLCSELGTRIGDDSSSWRMRTFEPKAARGAHTAQEGYGLAREVRRAIGASAEPLGDVRELVESRFGVPVLVTDLASTKVTALSLRDMLGAAIVLNGKDGERARNPALARVHVLHELCHVLFDPSKGGLHLVVDEGEGSKESRAEKRARAFAAEMLLPEEGLRRLFPGARTVSDRVAASDMVAKAKVHFGTPHEIAANHLANLGLVSPELREWLVANKAKVGKASIGTNLPRAGEPSYLLRLLVARAHDQGEITDGEARHALRLDTVDPLPWGTG
jgi:Zn-dependent peptidase ImmA (M78 family)/transcriptional regulator with XRE-family HTH domain